MWFALVGFGTQRKTAKNPGATAKKKEDYELTWECNRLKEKRVFKNTNNGYYRVINVGLMPIGYKPRERQVCYRIGISTSDTILSYRAGPWMYIYFFKQMKGNFENPISYCPLLLNNNEAN